MIGGERELGSEHLFSNGMILRFELGLLLLSPFRELGIGAPYSFKRGWTKDSFIPPPHIQNLFLDLFHVKHHITYVRGML